MCRVDQDTEDRVFAMLGTTMTVTEISKAIGLSTNDGYEVVKKVMRERGTPNLVAIRRARERLAAIKFSCNKA